MKPLDALRRWHEARSAGRTAVILGVNAPDLDDVPAEGLAAQLAEARRLDGRELLARWREDRLDPERLAEETAAFARGEDEDAGDEDDDEGTYAFVDDHEQVTFLELPCRPWEIPVHLGFGGWNEVPPAEELSAVLRHWYETYGAELVFVSGDTFELYVARPPGDAEGRARLAWEQYACCADLVDQGTERVAALARLLSRPRWFFWWD